MPDLRSLPRTWYGGIHPAVGGIENTGFAALAGNDETVCKHYFMERLYFSLLFRFFLTNPLKRDSGGRRWLWNNMKLAISAIQ